jgi:NAD(P)-dependent dehydrogenase (short-subunit alcohol dehydrogenase family)
LRFDPVACDVAPKLFDWAEASLGAIDILVNNAAHYKDEDETILSITAAGVADEREHRNYKREGE